MKKRLVAMILATCVASSSIPMTAWAEEPAGTETVQKIDEIEETEEKSNAEPKAETGTEESLPEEVTPEGKPKDDGQPIPEPAQEVLAQEEKEDDVQEEGTDSEKEEVSKENEDLEQPETSQTLAPEERTGGLQPLKIIELSESDSSQMEVVEPGQIQKSRSLYGSAQYNTYWDTYSSNYAYNRLTSAERAVWDGLDTIAKSYLLQNKSTGSYRDEETGDVSGEPKETVSYSSIGWSRAIDITYLFIYANPQYYFLEGSVFSYRDQQTFTLGFYKEFINGDVRRSQTNNVKSQIDAWEAEIAKEPTETLKAKKAHDLIIEKVYYDNNYEYSNLAKNPFHQSAYSVLANADGIAAGEAGYTVCAGYTKTFELLMNGAGVDTMAVTSPGHAWNIININDSWYHTDLTWDDWDGREGIVMTYEYFNRSGTAMTSERYHSPEMMYFGLLPVSTIDSGGRWDYVYTPSARTAVPTVSLKAVSGGVQVTLRSATPEAEIYYTLNGSNPSSNYTRSYLYSGSFVAPSNSTVKAMAVRDTFWDSSVTSRNVGKSCKITFKSNGGSSVSTKYVLSNSKITKPKNPTRSNKAFDGWYSDSKLKNAWNFNTKVTGNKTLYAKWQAKYTVKFDANKGSVKKKSQKVVSTKKYGTLPTPSRKGYTFSGWYTKKSGGTRITSSSKVKIKKTTTLYAHWKKISLKKSGVSKLQNQKGRKLQITAKKVSGADGYQIRYSKKSNMKSPKYASMAGKTVKTLTKLTKGKKYYIQVRAYKIDSTGKKKYGDWSSIKYKTISK